MQPFKLEFAVPDLEVNAAQLAQPPKFYLDPSNPHWIVVHVADANIPDIQVNYSQNSLFDLWLWSVAVARGLLPVTVCIEEENTEILLCAEATDAKGLRLQLIRRHSLLPSATAGDLSNHVVWCEARHDLLMRWSAMCSACIEVDLTPAPMCDVDWENLINIPILEAPPWTLAQRVAWFYLSMAYHLLVCQSGHTFLMNPIMHTLRKLDLVEIAVRAAHAAWTQMLTDEPPTADALSVIEAAREDIRQMSETSSEHPNARHQLLIHMSWRGTQAGHTAITAIADTLLAQLPITSGSFFADKHGCRSTLIRVQGDHWLLYWEDGRITQDSAFHAGRQPSALWPVAHGPCFVRDTLDPIDQRRLRFMELLVSPVCVVCPVCGYPCMDDDVDDVIACDICDYASLWRLTHGETPALDACVDEDGEPIKATLREQRARFLDHGDVWPADEPLMEDGREHAEFVMRRRRAEYRRLIAETLAEWDAWLDHPDMNNVPEEVWRRWNRLEQDRINHEG